MTSARPHVEALCDKYREMVCLQRHQVPEGDVRARMRALAERFPGALRELHEWPLADLEARLAVLEAASRGEVEEPSWALLQWSYHDGLRAALREKRRPGARNPRPATGRLVSVVLDQVAALNGTTIERVADALFHVRSRTAREV